MLGFFEKRTLLSPITFGHISTGFTPAQEVLNNVSLGKTSEDKWMVTCQAVSSCLEHPLQPSPLVSPKFCPILCRLLKFHYV